MAHVKIPGDLTLASDGRTVAFELTTVDVDRDCYVSQLWRVPTDGSLAAVRLTHGRRDSGPRLSPDGRWLAFRRGGDGGPTQLFLMPADGGEPRPVTNAAHHPLGVGTPVWSPDSTRLAYTTRVPQAGRYGTAEKAPPGMEPPRRITTLNYRSDGLGYSLDRQRQIYLIDPFDVAATPTRLTDDPFDVAATPTRLTDGDFDNVDVAWSPDGTLLAFASARHDDRDRTMTSDVFVIAPGGGMVRRVTGTQVACTRPVFSADAATIFFAGMELGDSGSDWFARHTGVYAVPADGSSPPMRLSDAERHTLDGTFRLGPGGVLFGNQHRGAIQLLQFGPTGGEPRVLIGGHRQAGLADVAQGTVVAVVADPTSFGDLVVVDDAGERTLTAFGAELAARADIRGMREVTTTAPDGYPVHGWVVKPAGAGPHPVLLMIHGGPFAQYGWRLFDEAQVYADAGYAVVLGNPRGSSGYGLSHGRYVTADVGARSAPDLLALLEHTLLDSDLDGRRLGVLGGSHGGYMANWLISHTNRFAAAVSERSINAIDSFLATADLGWAFTSLYGTDPEQHHRQSPLSHTDQINSPLLILHSEEDLRSPLEQAQRLYHALKSRGADVEMLIFPGEGHQLSRTGLPSHRRARFEAILAWFNRNLHNNGVRP